MNKNTITKKIKTKADFEEEKGYLNKMLINAHSGPVTGLDSLDWMLISCGGDGRTVLWD